jgi:hypothetical protein
MSNPKIEQMRPDYDFSIYEQDIQPSLFELDLPALEDKGAVETLSFEQVRRREEIAIGLFSKKLEEIKAMSDPARAEGGFSGVPAYYEVYLDLRDGGWPPRIAAYIAWASSPRQNRWPKTQDELALLLGLTSDRQFTKWRRANKAIDDLIAKLQIEPLLKHRADVFTALITSASTPDYKNQPDRKLYLEITGDHVPTTKVQGLSGVVVGMTSDDMVAGKSRAADLENQLTAEAGNPDSPSTPAEE